jgi:hypothetical protein
MIDCVTGIYIKSNPGSSGIGWIQNISYTNITMTQSLWWSIWIGPQQMHQPDGTFMGCDMRLPVFLVCLFLLFFKPCNRIALTGNIRYPFHSDVCPTNPLVTMKDITLSHVTATDGLNPYPGVVICNETNPCQNIVFDHVFAQEVARGEDKTLPFIVSHVYGSVIESSPSPEFIVYPSIAL